MEMQFIDEFFYNGKMFQYNAFRIFFEQFTLEGLLLKSFLCGLQFYLYKILTPRNSNNQS